MEREALKLALITLEGWDNHDKWVWPETALEQAKRNTKEAITAIKEALAQPALAPAAYAGIEMWIGGARITKHLTQMELHHARESWMLMQYSAELCLAKLKEKTND